MSVTILINDLTLCHRGSGGVARSTLPNPCKTPPDGKPVHYDNVAEASDLARGTASVTADGGHMCANFGSEFSRSSGDEAGALGGLFSGTHLAEATWITFSPDVQLEGAAACRLADKMFLNHANTACLSGLYQLDFNTPDAILYVLCQIFCETLEAMGEAPNKKPGKYSELAKKLGRDKYDDVLRAAVKKVLGAGAEVALEKTTTVAIKKGLVTGTKRVVLSASYLKRKALNAAMNAAKDKAAKAGTKAAAKGVVKKVVLKFIPFVNVASTAYDAYEAASLAYSVYAAVDTFMTQYEVYKIRPDAMFTTPDGKAKVYDYKFGKDDWTKGQYELYTAAGGEEPGRVDKANCGDCKKK